ncbi:hypothetical protein [Rhodopila sp.]|uniref:hypothetical protein n=1 Tax=Rhodopila sp. TaxID=2480087 RepID=UPI003D11B468
MNEPSHPEDRLLSVAEREMVDQTRTPGVATLSKDQLQALGKRLRNARDRARRIGRQQSREISGKGKPRGATPARDNTGTGAKAQALVDALQRVTAALRKLNAPTQAEVMRKAVERKRTATTTQHPASGRSANKGMAPKVSGRPTVKSDPREIGRVSQAVKVAQRKRDR